MRSILALCAAAFVFAALAQMLPPPRRTLVGVRVVQTFTSTTTSSVPTTTACDSRWHVIGPVDDCARTPC